MALIINSELFSKNITNEEFIELYRMVDGWYAFFFRDKKKEGFEYIVKAILDVIGYNVDIVTLEKESLFKKVKKIIEMTKKKIPYKEENGITKHNFIYIDDSLYKIKIDFNYIKYDFKDFESKYKYEEYENLDLPEVNSDEQEKIDDLNIFGMEWSQNNVTKDHMFLVNNLKTHYYKRAKVLHPDKGGNEDEFKKLSNTYEKLLKLRE
jgi:hypothetical protein